MGLSMRTQELWFASFHLHCTVGMTQSHTLRCYTASQIFMHMHPDYPILK